MRLDKIFTIVGTLLFFSTVAAAEIRIDDARYAGGVLVVRGHTTRPFQIIILDGHYKRRSNRDGRFIFRVPYRPRFCKIDLVSGSETKSVEVRNCSTNTRRLPRLKST